MKLGLRRRGLLVLVLVLLIQVTVHIISRGHQGRAVGRGWQRGRRALWLLLLLLLLGCLGCLGWLLRRTSLHWRGRDVHLNGRGGPNCAVCIFFRFLLLLLLLLFMLWRGSCSEEQAQAKQTKKRRRRRNKQEIKQNKNKHKTDKGSLEGMRCCCDQAGCRQHMATPKKIHSITTFIYRTS